MMRRFVLGGAILGVVAVVACTDNSANSLDPVGAPVYGKSQIVQGTNTPRGTASFIFRRISNPTQDSVRFTLSGIDSLETGFYTVWLGDSLNQATSFKRAPGILTVTRTDTSVNAQGDPVVAATRTTLGTNISSFRNGGPRSSFSFVTNRSLAGAAASDSIKVLLITIENSSTATTPNPRRRILWARRGDLTLSRVQTDTAKTTPPTPADSVSIRTGSLRFGNMGISRDSDYVYVPTGRGRVYFRANILEIEDSSLTLPPYGYFYAAYGVRRDSANKVVDTVYLGPLHSPFPRRDVSLREADSITVDPLVQPGIPKAILAASIRLNADTSAIFKSTTSSPYARLAQILVTLESKSKPDTRMGPSVILTADVPGIVRTPPK